MSDVQNHHLPADMDASVAAQSSELSWGAAKGRWSIGLALIVIAGISLTVWSGVLFALLA